MCLIGLALEQHPRFALVIAANRDEFLARPAAALDWWQVAPDAEPLLGGRDLHAGGTWMGLNANGRVAMLTNLRDLPRHSSVAPSRGAIVPEWLASQAPAADFWRNLAARGHNPFNLLAGDLGSGQWWWADDLAGAPQALGPGLYGLSNAALDTPWPKVQRLKSAMAAALSAATSPATLTAARSPESLCDDTSPATLEAALFAALADDTAVPDAALPDTGIGLERERWLAPAFIRTPDARYGTRCSTVLIVERHAAGLGARFIERQFAADGAALSQRGVRWARWPLAHGDLPQVQAEPVSAA